MKQPEFWKKKGVASTLLRPFSVIYGLVGRVVQAQKSPYRAGCPVICVGNLTVGGTGKTPTVIHLVELLKARDLDVHVVTRGYRGSAKGPLQVDIASHGAALVGDEPLLLAAHTTTWVAKDRAAGVRAAEDAGAEIIILDDGHQNRSVEKDLSLVVVDGGAGFGNGLVLPAGPLRETLKSGLGRTDAIIVIGEDTNGVGLHLEDIPVMRATIKPKFSGISLDGVRVFAFAGIGRPEKFFDTLRGQGAVIVDSEKFPDHHVYDLRILERLMTRANAQDLMVVTTEKDAVKLPRLSSGRIWPVPIELKFENPDQIDGFLDVITTQSQ